MPNIGISIQSNGQMSSGRDEQTDGGTQRQSRRTSREIELKRHAERQGHTLQDRQTVEQQDRQ